ncbi:MAG: mechanosensitive ion channel family protein [Burkholderiales bacterium]|jgi:small-conductance mechanosensitive channel
MRERFGRLAAAGRIWAAAGLMAITATAATADTPATIRVPDAPALLAQAPLPPSGTAQPAAPQAAAVAQGPASPGVSAQSAAPPAAPLPASAPAVPEATLTVFNRPIVVMRAPLFASTPAERARRARLAIDETLALGGPGEVQTEAQPLGTVVKVDGRFAFIVQPDDADRQRGETAEEAARIAVAQLREAIAATREARDLSGLLRSLLIAAAATVVAGALALGCRAVFRALGRRLLRVADSGAERLKLRGTELLQRDRLLGSMRVALVSLRWAVTAVIAYEWLGFVLQHFAYTRPWGEQLNRFLLGILSTLAGGILGALPDLLIAAVIFALAGMAARGLAAFLERAARTPGTLDWLDTDTVGPAKRLGALGIWLFAIAMAYPYLPGSGTEAFKGLSVLVGVMISLGGSSLIGQGASGLVIMYTRTLRIGEFVNIDGHEGTVVELGTFTTRVRTGRGEELTLPNSLVMGTVTRNYSRTVKGRGFILDTEVTIGYDTPWRQVHAMLLEAARRTPGVLADPAPKVFQVALSDFYPQYRLVCQAVPEQPRPRAEILSSLHANIQDVFNENGVQIMSPHYFGDPGDAKSVPPERWAPPLAARVVPREGQADAAHASPGPRPQP